MMWIIKILVCSLFCNGMYLLFNFGNVLEFIRKWWIDISGGIQNNSGAINWTYGCNDYIHPKKVFLYKPLFGCITCMASIWGSLSYWIITYALKDISIESLLMYPILIVCVASMNLIINNLYE